MLKTMVVGCGRIAGNHDQALTTHGGAYQAEKTVKIIACLDFDLERRIAFADSYQCDAEQDLLTALKKHQPDIVSVCTPDNTHFNITEDILFSVFKPKVIFLEKPACSSRIELNKLINKSNQVNVPIVVNHSRRFDQQHQQLKELISTGEFGVLRDIIATYYSGWKHNGVHIIDTLSYLLTDSVVIESITNGWESPYKNDPTIEVRAILKNQKSKIKIMSFNEDYFQIFEIDLRFDLARIRLEDFGERILLEKKTINDIGENVIQMVENGLTKKTVTSMQQAIGLICKSIQEENFSLLDGYLLSDISDTMNTIWQGQEMYEKNRFN